MPAQPANKGDFTMSGRETWKGLDQTVPVPDRSIQKECGMISEHWRQANGRYRCAARLSRKARSRADIHAAAAAHAAEASSASVWWTDFGPYGPNAVKFLHELLSKRYLAIAEAHMGVAEAQREEASDYAATLTSKLTNRLVQQRLDALDSETAAAITLRFGGDITDPQTRARVFEVCDWLQFGSSDEDRLAHHVSIPLRRE
jgi:hypothetical protein